MKWLNFIVLLIVYAPSLFACEIVYDENFLKKLNINARVEVQHYVQLNQRDLRDAKNEIGLEFSSYLETFSKNHKKMRVFDSGGGDSIYGIELAKEGNDVTVSNSQSNYEEMIFPIYKRLIALKDIKNRDTLNEEIKRLKQDPHLSFDSLQLIGDRLTLAMPNPFSHSGHEYLDLLIDKTQKINESIQNLMEHHFHYEIGYSEDIVKKQKDNSLDLIIDLYGAFTYSATRPFLLQNFYKKVKMGGKAFINIDLLDDRIKVQGVWQANIYRYLVETYPQIFTLSLGLHGSANLIITKSEPSLPFQLEVLKVDFLHLDLSESMSVPRLDMRVIP